MLKSVDVDFHESSKPASKDFKFDSIIGEMENLLMDRQFIDLQQSFFSENCKYFSNDDENKLVYTDVFNKYVSLIESFIASKLVLKLEWFDMPEFLNMLKDQKMEELEGDVFDVLLSLGDFQCFKDTILAFKSELEGKSIDLDGILTVSRN